MLICKLFCFENVYVVCGCSMWCCLYLIYGYLYCVELLFEVYVLDYGQMIYDFGLFKGDVYDLIDVFDYVVMLWLDDDLCYVESMCWYLECWVLLLVLLSVEQFLCVLFWFVDVVLLGMLMLNGEVDV